MHKLALTAIAMTGAMIALAAPAAACPSGYHAAWIQGNKVCAHNVGGNGQLKANTGPKLKKLKPIRAAKVMKIQKRR